MKHTRPTSRVTLAAALLRGINVGGKNSLPMAALRAMFEDAGCQQVRSYLQSGNVVFAAPRALQRQLPALIQNSIHSKLRLQVPVLVRTAQELSTVAKRNPFLTRKVDPKALHVMFLRDKPSPSRVRALDPDRSSPDAFAVVGREVFLHCPNGMGRSKLTTGWFDRGLGTVSTARNWRTVLTLVEMTRNTQA